MNILKSVWGFVKNKLSNNDEESYSTPMIMTKKQEAPVFRAKVGEGLNKEQAAKAQEVVTKNTITKLGQNKPVFRAELLPGVKEKIVTKAANDPVLKAYEKQWSPIQFTAGQVGRGLISASLAASGKNVYTPATEFETALFGNNPIYNSKLTARRIIDGENNIDVRNQGGLGMLALGLGINTIDVSDIFTGGGKKGILTKIAKLDKAEDITTELRKVLGKDFDAEMLTKASEDLSSISTYTDVRNYIKDLTGVNKILDAQREARMIDGSFSVQNNITKQTIDNIANSKDTKIISDELTKIGITPEAQKGFAEQLKNISDPHEIYTILNNTIEPDKGNMLGSINLDKLDLKSPEAKANLRQHYEAAKDDIELAKGAPVSNRELLEAAEESKVLSKIMTRAESLELGAKIKAAQSKLSYIENRIVETTNLETRKQLVEEAMNLTQVVDAAASFGGRLLNYFKTAVNEAEGTVVNRVISRINKTGADRTKVLDDASKVDWNNADEVVRFYRTYVKPKATEIISEYRYNSMLSNPRSHIRNISTNALQAVITRPLTRTVEAGIDLVSSALTGKNREVYFKEVPSYYRASLGNIFKATGDAWDAMKGKNIASQLLEAEGRIPTGRLPKFLRIPTLALEAGDRFFTRMITEGEKAALMKRGYNEAKASKEASKAALYSVFRQGIDPSNKTGQGMLLSHIDKATMAIDQMRKIPGVDWFIPFLRTPMNIAKQMVEYSPVGLLNMKGNTNKKEALAKVFIGSVISAWGAKEAYLGNTTWGVPKDAEEKELFYASGKKPYSIRVGDKWVPMIYFGPLAYALALPAAFKYHHQDSHQRFTDSEFTKIGKTISAGAGFWTQQTFLENLGNMMDLAGNTDGKTLEKNVAFMATQAIPMSGLLRYVSTIVDPIFRKSNTFLEEVEKGLPFLSKNLDAYKDPGVPGISGQESSRKWWNYLAPWDITSERSEYNNLLEQRSEELDNNNYTNRNNNVLKEQATKMFEDFMSEDVTDERIAQIQKELSTNEQLKNTFKTIVKTAGITEAGLIDPITTFKDPKYTAEVIYVRTQTAETDEEWQENVVDFISMLEGRGLMTEEVKEEIKRLATADAEKDRMNELEDEEEVIGSDQEWEVDITEE